MQNELHVFIIWSNALHLQQQIIEDIKIHFEIKKVFRCHWPKELFSYHLVQFYHKKMYHCCKKEKDCGNGDFLLIVVNDTNPQYQNNTNIRMRELKQKYREWSKKNFLIHCSDTQKEAEENLYYLTHLSSKEFYKKYPSSWDNQIETLNCPSPKVSKMIFLPIKVCQIIRKFI